MNQTKIPLSEPNPRPWLVSFPGSFNNPTWSFWFFSLPGSIPVLRVENSTLLRLVSPVCLRALCLWFVPRLVFYCYSDDIR